MVKYKYNTAIKIILPLIIAALSFFLIAKPLTSPETYKNSIQSLDDKKATVMKMAAASTAASVAISAIPDDTASPIANKLADLSQYFLIVLCAILLEKYLLTITGFAAFKLLIPIACILISIYFATKIQSLKKIAVKMIALGLAVFLAIPAGIKVSDIIQNTYDTAVWEQVTAQSDDNKADNTEKSTDTASAESNQSQAQSSGILGAITDKLTGVKDAVTNAASNAADSVSNTLNKFIEALAVLIVTTCIIPILVLIFFIWIIKLLTGLNINLPVTK